MTAPWWFNFLFCFTGASVAMGALCWQLWRCSNDESQQSGSRNLEDFARSNMQPTRYVGMTVSDLIHVLQQYDPAAIVALWEHAPYEGQLSKLVVGEVLSIQLGSQEANGLLLIEEWRDGVDGLQGPFPGVVLGSS